MPSVQVPLVDGGVLDLGELNDWTIVVVYRGRHCARCKPYLSKLNTMLADLSAIGVAGLAISADPQDRAEADVAEFKWQFPVGYDLSFGQMRQLGLFVSDSIKPAETGRPFAEPGLFVINGDGLVQIVEMSNSASVRPDLDLLLDGIRSIKEKGIPIRGLAA
ncbi:redoxin domain-containing protein [Roseobacter sp. YSTF-M11]|uniref:Redoxin domain-containing protein n=2 Tax=Roseobacter insulae TaxID=2859783 RepID=A0A9X1FY39_9RHOB|nr:redoxin domain-containing protein [Roseobacter insulae]